MKKIISIILAFALLLIPSYAVEMTEAEPGQTIESGQMPGDYSTLALSSSPTMISPIEYEEFPYDESVKVDWVAPQEIGVSYYRVRVRKFIYDDESKSFIPEDPLIVDTIVNSQTTEFDVSYVELERKCKYRYAVAAVTIDRVEYWTQGYFYTGTHNGFLSPPISFYIGNYFADLTKNQIYYACQTWNDELNLGYEVVNTYPFTQGTDLTEYNNNDGLNCITGTYRGDNDILMKEYERYNNKKSCKAVEIDIEVNKSYPWANTPGVGTFDVQGVMTHELGHAIGLIDMYDSEMVDWTMYYNLDPNTTKYRTPEVDEVVSALNFY